MGEDVVFDITITNTGDVDLVTVPLTDTWDADLPAVPDRQRRPQQHPARLAAPGTTSARLAPAASHTVRITMTALASTAAPELNTAITAPTVPPQEPPVPPQTNEPPYEISDPMYLLTKSVVAPTRPRRGHRRGLVVFDIVVESTTGTSN